MNIYSIYSFFYFSRRKGDHFTLGKKFVVNGDYIDYQKTANEIKRLLEILNKSDKSEI